MGDLIEEFIEKKSLDALNDLLSSDSNKDIDASAIAVADVFGSETSFSNIIKNKSDEAKLITSFTNNLVLLIQKTWIEKSDEELKAQVLYHLEEFCKNLESKNYSVSFRQFFSIVDDMVYLMFGSQAKSKDFAEYALRIDPEFGIFWWYVSSIPKDAEWESEKNRVVILLGMYFLANY